MFAESINQIFMIFISKKFFLYVLKKFSEYYEKNCRFRDENTL